MDILITGNLATVSSSFCDKLSDNCHVIASSPDLNLNYIGSIYKKFVYKADEDSFAKLFHIYSFEAVIVFLKRPEPGSESFQELHELDSIFSLCQKHDVPKVILVSSTYLYHGNPHPTEDTVVFPTDSETLRLWSCERLCDLYSNRYGISILKLHVPSLFGLYENRSMVGRMMYEAATKSCINMDGDKKQTFDFLSQEDLAELISRVLTEWPEKYTTMNLSGASSMTLEELESCLSGIVSDTRITYSGKPAADCPPVSSTLARKDYDWLPVVDIRTQIPLLYRHIHKKGSQKTTLKEKIRSAVSSKSIIIRTVEILLCFLLMEYLNSFSDTVVQFRYVDFRLLFVVLISIVNGLKSGIVASLLASFSCLMGFIAEGMDWHIILYNIDNWLPFACYIIAGAVIGYTKDKKDSDFKFVSDEKETLEKRHAFLNELYQSALQSKNQYKKQIMSYRNSFGRLFDATRRLNTLTPDVVFKEALFVLEDILDNQTICIYCISGNSRFARLKVSSKKILNNAPKSINLDRYPAVISQLAEGEVWVNTACLPEYPDYVFPVFRNGELNSLILIMRASHDQMAMYYENLIKILCNLIEDTLVRAQKYTDEFGDDAYIPGSRVLKKEAFKKILSVREQMAKESIAEYSMLGIDADSESIVGISERIRKYFRDTDIFGQGEDGKLYVVLAQAGKDTSAQIINRLKSAGVI